MTKRISAPSRCVLGLFARFPEPGAVKTRLASSIGAAPAARLHAAFVEDTLAHAQNVAVRRIVAITPDGPEPRRWFRRIGGSGFAIWPQPGGSLGDRQAAFFRWAAQEGAARIVVMGTDSPSLPAAYVSRAFAMLDHHDAVIGPAADGGYYLLGLRGESERGIASSADLLHKLFRDVEWSSSSVCATLLTRLRELGRSIGRLPEWYDVDTLEDLRKLRHDLLVGASPEHPAPCRRTTEILAQLEGSIMPQTTAERRYRIVDFSEIPGVDCPCGTARRAFGDVPEYPATIHVTEIEEDARLHYHVSHTETYYILECEPDAAMQLDDEVIPVRAGCCILIPPRVRHRAIGRMRIVNIVFPKFDPADEHFD